MSTIEFQRYMISGEHIVQTANPVELEGERGYSVAVTNKRLLLLKKNKFDKIMLNGITSMNWESERKYGRWLLLLGLLLIIAYGVGILLIILWFVSKKETLSVYGPVRRLALVGQKYDLDRIVFNVRSQQSQHL